ncbi:MAG: response regulator [Candidatus Obscuribacterales bacterium]|nr:response regulator [Candidatus Obscuribacterales bacterium]
MEPHNKEGLERRDQAVSSIGKPEEPGLSYLSILQEKMKVVKEHPVESALAATAILGAGALAKRAIGRYFASGAGRGVLLVEDTPYTGKALKEALELEGEQVTWLRGVKRADGLPHQLKGIGASGEEVVLDTRKFKGALVDGELEGSYLQGAHVVDALKKGHLPSIGISSNAESNALLRRSGASASAEKPTALASILAHKVDFALLKRNPAALQSGMDGVGREISAYYKEGLRLQGDTARAYEQSEKLLRRFLSE